MLRYRNGISCLESSDPDPSCGTIGKIDMIHASPQLLDEAKSRGGIKCAGPEDRRHDKKCIRVLKCGFSFDLAGSASDAETPGPGNRRLNHVDNFGIEWIDNRNSRRNHFVPSWGGADGRKWARLSSPCAMLASNQSIDSRHKWYL